MLKSLLYLFPGVTWRIRTNEKLLFLTFDDGPAPGITDVVLDLLSKHRAAATFFCIGANIERNPELFKRISEEGHAAGNHSWSHPNGWRTSTVDYIKDVNACRKYFSEEIPLFRPPYGKFRWSQLKEIRKRYTVVMWDVITRDWKLKMNADDCFQRVVADAVPGSIVVFHDSEKAAPRMLDALEKTLVHFTSLGYKFDSLKNHV